MNELPDKETNFLKVQADPLIGQKIAGRYEILSVIGQGGMGVVYKACHLSCDRFVALKTLHINHVLTPSALKQFQLEAKAINKVRHPHTVNVFDFGVNDNGQPYLVMDFLEGVSLRKLLEEQGLLPLDLTNDIFQQVVDVLACAHEHNIVHRDLKPEHIFLVDKPGFPNWVYVLDFGLASWHQACQAENDLVIGSPPYMSPEQCAADGNIDPRSDIYSLAVCLFEALSGQIPFEARSAYEVMQCHISKEPLYLKDLGTRFSTYESTSNVIAKALAKSPESRYQTIMDFGKELWQAVNHDSKRGLALRERMKFETPRKEEFVETRQDVLQELASSLPVEKKNIFAKLYLYIKGDKLKSCDPAPGKYVFYACPHCGESTKKELALCLSCGRSLVSRDDFSKIRIMRGEFSLPKHEGLNTEPGKQTKSLRLKTNNFWRRLTFGCVFVVCLFVLIELVKLFENLAKLIGPG